MQNIKGGGILFCQKYLTPFVACKFPAIYSLIYTLCRFLSNFQEFQLQYWKFYMLFISLRVFTKNFESTGLIPPELQHLGK